MFIDTHAHYDSSKFDADRVNGQITVTKLQKSK